MKFFRTLIYIVCLGFVTIARADEAGDFETIQKYLGSLNTIRAHIVDAPGFGHQQATLLVLKRMVALGFRGKFEVVYSEHAENKVKVLTGFKPDFIPLATIEYIARSVFSQMRTDGRVSQLPLGIIGAEDELRKKPTRAAELGVDTLVRLQPPFWTSGTRSIEYPGGKVSDLDKFSQLGIYETFERTADVSQFAFDQLKTSAPLIANNLREAYRLDRKHKVMTVYGFHALGKRVPSLLQIINGVRMNQVQEPRQIVFPAAQPIPKDIKDSEPPLKKSMVIIVAGLTPTEFEEKNLISEIGKLGLNEGGIEFVSTSEDLSRKLPTLGEGKILVYPTGWLSEELILQLMTNSDFLAAGGNRMRHFLLQRGLPFIEVQDVKLPHLGGFSKEVQKFIYSQTADFVFENKIGPPGKGSAHLLLDLLSPQSVVRAEFQKNALPITERDIVFQGLLPVAKKFRPIKCDLSKF